MMENKPEMTLRDYFAGQALTSVVTKSYSTPRIEGETHAERWAFEAYAVADAMLAEKEKDND